jgi:hypothetical protein
VGEREVETVASDVPAFLPKDSCSDWVSASFPAPYRVPPWDPPAGVYVGELKGSRFGLGSACCTPLSSMEGSGGRRNGPDPRDRSGTRRGFRGTEASDRGLIAVWGGSLEVMMRRTCHSITQQLCGGLGSAPWPCSPRQMHLLGISVQGLKVLAG